MEKVWEKDREVAGLNIKEVIGLCEIANHKFKLAIAGKTQHLLIIKLMQYFLMVKYYNLSTAKSKKK